MSSSGQTHTPETLLSITPSTSGSSASGGSGTGLEQGWDLSVNPQPCTDIFGVKEPSNGEHLPELKPCKAKHESILLFLPFLGAVAHLKKIISLKWHLETPRARNWGGAGGAPAWLEGVTNSPTVLLETWMNEKKQNLKAKMGSAAPG